MPLYRHPKLRILVEYTPGSKRGIGYPDFEAHGAEDALRAMWAVWSTPRLGGTPRARPGELRGHP